jgi:hypothetical protein
MFYKVDEGLVPAITSEDYLKETRQTNVITFFKIKSTKVKKKPTNDCLNAIKT